MKKYAIVDKETREFYPDPSYTDVKKAMDKIDYLVSYRTKHGMAPEEYELEELTEEREKQHDAEMIDPTKKIIKWAKNIESYSGLIDACQSLNLSIKRMDKRWQWANGNDLADYQMVYFILTGDSRKFSKWFA